MNIKTISDLYYNKTNIGFVFWFLFGILITFIGYKPFDQPILMDRAYLLHMSQVVYRGDALYNTTPFGYTPFSTILVGLFMKLGSIFSLNTIESARILGLVLYGTISGSIFILSKTLFNTKKGVLIACFLFCGLGYIQILSGINAEPKLWVLLFSIFGIYFFNKERWFLVGLFFSLGAMSWHVAVISLFACAFMLLWKPKTFIRSLAKLFFGVFVGVLPVLFYLLITNGWMDFWNQAVVRKLVVEGAEVGESPFLWVKSGLYPCFILEPLHFVFGGIGFVMGLYYFLKYKEVISKIPFSKNTFLFLVFYSLFWILFNSIDFQTAVDLLTLIPPIIIFGTYFLICVVEKLQSKYLYIVGLIFITYNFFDAFMYKLPYTFSEQVKTIEDLQKQYKRLFVIGFEEYYTILEKPMPTKFMRYASYEDHMIENFENGCTGIVQFIANNEFDAIIEYDSSRRGRSKPDEWIKNVLKRDSDIKINTERVRSSCASQIIENLTSSNETKSFSLKNQKVPLSDCFYEYRYYSIFSIQSNN